MKKTTRSRWREPTFLATTSLLKIGQANLLKVKDWCNYRLNRPLNLKLFRRF